MSRRVVIAGMGVVVAAVALPGLLSCGAVSRAIDGRALAAKAALVVERTTPPAAGLRLPYTDRAELEALTRPVALAPAVRPLERHRRDDPGLVQEELSFASPVSAAFEGPNRAVAYVYRHGPLGARPVVLWVPGLSVSELAFVPIQWFLGEILRRDVDVVFYVLPYHLERGPPDVGSGDAVLATPLDDHLRVLAQGLADVRSLTVWLRAQGVRELGAFGGSLGAWLLESTVAWDGGLDFMTLMIPLVSWDDVVFRPGELAPARAHLAASGFDLDALAQLYRDVDPTRLSPRIDPARVSLLLGEYDLVASPVRARALARAWGVERVRTYPRGHALMLLTYGLYADYGRELERDLVALRAALAGDR